MERSFIFLKPDCIHQNLMGEVITDLEKIEGLRFVRAKIESFTIPQLRTHYAHVVEREFYPAMEAFLLEVPVWMFIVEGPGGIIELIRQKLGPTDSNKADPETIRGKWGSRDTVYKNIAHASDSPQAAAKEIELFFA